MLIRHGVIAATVLIMCGNTAASAVTPVKSLEPSSKWLLDYNPSSCRLLRVFGTGDDEVVAQFNQYKISNGAELRLIGKPVKIKASQSVRVAFGDEAFRDQKPKFGTIGNNLKPIIIFGFMNLVKTPDDWPANESFEPQPEQIQAIDRLTVDMPGDHDFVLQTGSMGPPMEAMRKCSVDLVRNWGFDPDELQPAISAKPVSGLPTYGDYPTQMVRLEHEGTVYIALAIDALGKVEKCHVQSIIDDPKFADVTCSIMLHRAKFEPARNADGKPVSSLYQTSVTYILGR